MKVYLLFYSNIEGDNELIGIYTTYQKASENIPYHEDTDYYEIYETNLDEKITWNEISY